MMRGLRTGLSRAPLWVRLVAGTLLLVAVALALTGFVGTRLLRGYLLDRVDQQLGMISHPRGRPPPDYRPPPVLQERFRELPSFIYAVTLDANGNVVGELSETVTGARPKLPRLTTADVAQRGDHPFTVHGSGSDADWRVIAVPTEGGQTRVVAVSLGDVDSTVARLTAIDAAVGAIALICLGVAGYVLVRASLRPLVEIEATAVAIAAGCPTTTPRAR